MTTYQGQPAITDEWGQVFSVPTWKAAMRGRRFDTQDTCSTLDKIKAVVAHCFGVTVSEIESDRRAREIAIPRFAYCHIAKHLTRHSLPKIASAIHRDHTTIMHSIRRVNGLLQTDELFKEKYNQCLTQLSD